MPVIRDVPARKYAFRRLDEIRATSGLSLRGFMKEIGYTPGNYTKWRNGTVDVPYEAIEAAHEKFGIPRYYFLLSDEEALEKFESIVVQAQKLESLNQVKKVGKIAGRLQKELRQSMFENTDSYPQNDPLIPLRVYESPGDWRPNEPVTKEEAQDFSRVIYVDPRVAALTDLSLRVKTDAMVSARMSSIHPGDAVLVKVLEPGETVEEGKVYVVKPREGEWTLRRCHWIEDHFELLADNADSHDREPFLVTDSNVWALVLYIQPKLIEP